jgi:hypothetical protein
MTAIREHVIDCTVERRYVDLLTIDISDNASSLEKPFVNAKLEMKSKGAQSPHLYIAVSQAVELPVK